MYPAFEATLAVIMAKQAANRLSLIDGQMGVVSDVEHVTKGNDAIRKKQKMNSHLAINAICE
jgi:hypothetical protein